MDIPASILWSASFSGTPILQNQAVVSVNPSQRCLLQKLHYCLECFCASLSSTTCHSTSIRWLEVCAKADHFPNRCLINTPSAISILQEQDWFKPADQSEATASHLLNRHDDLNLKGVIESHPFVFLLYRGYRDLLSPIMCCFLHSLQHFYNVLLVVGSLFLVAWHSKHFFRTWNFGAVSAWLISNLRHPNTLKLKAAKGSLRRKNLRLEPVYRLLNIFSILRWLILWYCQFDV